MNKEILIGKIVDTHGIKGELRIRSDFELKDQVFKPGFIIYIGDNRIPEVIKSYRHHKEFDMVTLGDYHNINEVLKYLKEMVYIKREDLLIKKDDYLLSDLIGLDIKENEKILGKVEDYVYNKANTLLVVTGKNKFYIPLQGDYVTKVDLDKKVIEVKNTEGLIL